MKMHDQDLIKSDIEAYLEQHRTKELLPFLTCGSVDDGKSTLIGRLLHDTKMIYEDQFAAVERDSKKYGTTGDEVDLALLTDGLQAEREQGITIDVAYRYFSTSKRKFIIADAPGHEQYTRNMATGASNCNLAVILVDARHGVLAQTRRHSFISSLLGIKHVVVAINKMDLVDYDREVFERIRRDFSDFAAKLDIRDILFIPMSALKGDNVVTNSENTPWYAGPPLLDHLETVHIAGDRNLIDMRFPVQYVMRPHLDFRGYAGTIASGVLKKGREVIALPSGKRSKVKSIVTYDGSLNEAFAPMSVVVTLEDEIDVSRGDILVYPGNRPRVANRFDAMLVAMYEEPISPDRPYLLKHSNVTTPAAVTGIEYGVDINTMHRVDADELALNEIGRIRVETNRPVAFDPYARNRQTGAFILIDRLTNATVAAGMILERGTEDEDRPREREASDAGRDVAPVRSRVSVEERVERLGQRPFAVWLTGVPRSGKSSIAFGVEKALFDRGLSHVVAIDGANLRTGLNKDLGFSGLDRAENVRRAAELAKFVCDSGQIALVAMVSPFAADRALARDIIGPARFLEVLCDAPVDVCEARDDSGLYAKARTGAIPGFTGVEGNYERPTAPDLALDTENETLDTSVDNVIQHLERLGLLKG